MPETSRSNFSIIILNRNCRYIFSFYYGKNTLKYSYKNFPTFLKFHEKCLVSGNKGYPLLQRIFLPSAITASQKKNVPVIFLILVFIYKKYEKARALIFRKTLLE